LAESALIPKSLAFWIVPAREIEQKWNKAYTV